MRTRNIKINVYLNEEENKLLKEKSNKAKLSKSDFIRNSIEDYKEDEQLQIDLKGIAKIILDNTNDLLKLKNRLHYLGYFKEEDFLQDKIDIFNILIKNIKS